MSDSIIAIADTVFPSLDPAKKALSGQTSEDFRMSNDSSAESILAVAADADALLVTYSQINAEVIACLLYTSPSPRDATLSRMPSSA